MDSKSEWLEADGLGGFASGTVGGIRTRRYHALLLTATTPPTGRMVLVNGLEAWLETPAGTFALSAQRYHPDVVHPDGQRRLESFEAEPWPQWTFHCEDGTRLRHELFVPHGSSAVVLSWRLVEPRKGVSLVVRPLLSGRDYHALHHGNPYFRFYPEVHKGQILWRPYDGVPGVIAFTNGQYLHQPDWYRNFLYEKERERGLDYVEDLASPGVFRWDLGQGEAACILATEGHEKEVCPAGVSAQACLLSLRDDERRRRQRFASPLHRSADAYLVRRGAGATVIAGYPWFTDWGRDTFISLRGLCLATGRLDDARQILLAWAETVSDGMLPNRFLDRGETAEYNAVDASLWYVIAVDAFLKAWEQNNGGAGETRNENSRSAAPALLHSPAGWEGGELSPAEREALEEAVEAILSGYARGTRFGIHVDDDGLLAAGQPGLALTWMDARVDGRGVTPRIGKPVEVQALWLNALHVGARLSPRWETYFSRGRASFQERFWNEAGGYLYDVVDPGYQRGAADATFRPNQIFAVGGLPLVLLEREQARRVVDAVEGRLWTPAGLRTLAPAEPEYAGRYDGGVRQRDQAYHQGPAWPWLLGPFIEAWVRVRGDAPEARREARASYLQPLLRLLDQAGLGHIAELADGDPPHTLRGCPFQAWSLAEALRLALDVLDTADEGPPEARINAAAWSPERSPPKDGTNRETQTWTYS